MKENLTIFFDVKIIKLLISLRYLFSKRKFGISKEIKPNLNISKKIIFLAIFNKGQYLKRSIRSIKRQTLKDIDILPINDNKSTDNSLDVLKQIANKDSKIKIKSFLFVFFLIIFEIVKFNKTLSSNFNINYRINNKKNGVFAIF
jgi:GT2 family glycosyltransferase